MKVLIVLAILVAIVYGQTFSNLDPFDGVSIKLDVPGTSAESFSDSTVQSDILGGERDMIIRGTGTGSSSNCESETFVENGAWFANNGQTCAASAVLQYDGVDGSGDLAMGLGVNLNNIGVAFLVDVQTDLTTSFTIEIYSSVSSVSSITQTIQASQSLLTYTFPFGDFSGNADISNIGAIQLIINEAQNTDVIVTLFDLVSDEISGRVFSDCNCNGTQDSDDGPLQGVLISATPNSDCPQGTLSQTTTTDVNGDWILENLAGCQYTINVDGACGNTGTRVVDASSGTSVNFGIEQAGSLSVPADVVVSCTDSTEPTNTGQATCSAGQCGGSGGSVTFSDNIVPGNCDASFTIVRAWTCGAETLNQQITVEDNNSNPTLSLPSNANVNCGESTDPSNTGTATATDSCSSVSVDFSDQQTTDCNLDVCGVVTTISRTWTATDNCGNTASNVQTIIVGACGDGEVPDCPTVTSSDDDNCPDYLETDDDFCACPSDDDSSSSDASFLVYNSILIIFVVFCLF
jgi:hypothetical protein